jgi:hypothetical protein
MTVTENEKFLLDAVFKLGIDAFKDLRDPRPYRIWVSMYGAEEAWDGEKWKRVKPGIFLAKLVGPSLPFLRRLEDLTKGPHNKTDLFELLYNATKDLPLPEATTGTPWNNFVMRIHYLCLALECIGLLIRGRSSAFREGPGIAKRMLAEIPNPEFQGELAEYLASRPLTFWLSAAWQGSDPILDCRNGKFGFQIQSSNPWTAALAEGLLLILFNVRRIRRCPHCNTLHWDKKRSVCEECRRRQDRQRKANKPPTLEGKFRNKVSQAKSRKRITADQATRILNVLARDGLSPAERLYGSLLERKAERRE